VKFSKAFFEQQRKLVLEHEGVDMGLEGEVFAYETGYKMFQIPKRLGGPKIGRPTGFLSFAFSRSFKPEPGADGSIFTFSIFDDSGVPDCACVMGIEDIKKIARDILDFADQLQKEKN
jgi:hypothetical protein